MDTHVSRVQTASAASGRLVCWFVHGFVLAHLAMLALFLRFAQGDKNLLDPLRDDAYGMNVVHYIPCLWLQYALLDAPLPAIPKALIVFIGTVALSWGVTSALRRIPGVKRVL